MSRNLKIAVLVGLVQLGAYAASPYVPEPKAVGKDVDGIVAGLQQMGFICKEIGLPRPDAKNAVFTCGNVKLAEQCRSQTFMYMVLIDYDPKTRLIDSMSRTDCF